MVIASATSSAVTPTTNTNDIDETVRLGALRFFCAVVSHAPRIGMARSSGATELIGVP